MCSCVVRYELMEWVVIGRKKGILLRCYGGVPGKKLHRTTFSHHF